MAEDCIINKNIKRKPLRKRQTSLSEEDNEEDEEFSTKLENLKTLQKLRERPNGVSIVGLALGKKVEPELEVGCTTDPFKIKSGGMINMNALKSGKIKKVDDAYDTGIGTQFSAETNKRDEDEEMMKYIESELTQRKIKVKEEEKEEKVFSNDKTYCSPEEAALQSVPKHLISSSTIKSEEMLSNQMLSGIPEVDLGIEAKIKNIEATEEAKMRLIYNSKNKNDGPSQFVPTNMAVNFVQHNRFNIDETDVKGIQAAAKAKIKPTPIVKAPEDKPNGTKRKDGEKATDDYHYEKFKKQFRRH